MHVHCLHLLMLTGMLFLSAFRQPCKSTTGEIMPKKGSNLAVGSDIAPTISACLSRPCNRILALCGCIATLNYTICMFFLLCLNYCHHPCHAHTPPTHPLVFSGPILMNCMKKSSKTGKKQPLSTCQVSFTKANR